MPTCKEMFKLTLKVVELIEHTACQQISHLSRSEALTRHMEPEAADNYIKIIGLLPVLGNQQNQKTGLGQKYHTGLPPVRLANQFIASQGVSRHLTQDFYVRRIYEHPFFSPIR